MIGIAAPYDVPRLVPDKSGVRYQFARGCFDDSIQRGNVCARLNHLVEYTVAAMPWSSLRFTSLHNQAGLHFEMTLVEQCEGEMVLDARSQGRLNGCSVGLTRLADATFRMVRGVKVFERVNLLEVSLCLHDSRPSFPGTWAGVSSMNAKWST